MKFVEKTVISETPPNITNVVWLNPTTKEIKYFVNGEWSTVYGVLSGIINDILETVEEILSNPSMLTFKQGSLDWSGTEQVIAPEDIEASLGITIAQAKALVNGEIPFIKVYDGSNWYGLMFTDITTETSFRGSYEGSWDDISVICKWDDQTGLSISASHN